MEFKKIACIVTTFVLMMCLVAGSAMANDSTDDSCVKDSRCIDDIVIDGEYCCDNDLYTILPEDPDCIMA